MGQWIELPGTGGGAVKGYLATPAAGDGAPGVVVLQEFWGLGSSKSHITYTCDRLAEAGYRGFAPDLYHGQKAETADAANALMKALDRAAAVDEVRASVEHLGAGGKKMALLGFCMGGALTIASALHGVSIAALVSFYGIPPQGDASKLRVPFLGHFATRDDWCNASTVGELERQLAAGHVEHTIHWYEASHAFMNLRRPEVHDPEAARIAWERTLAFLRSKLG